MPLQFLAVDANIMLGATLGVRVRHLMGAYSSTVRFYATSECVDEVIRNLPAIAARRAERFDTIQASFLKVLKAITIIEFERYSRYRPQALARIPRDPKDWHVVALAMALKCPIWTEDSDFFGCGIPTWTSPRLRYT